MEPMNNSHQCLSEKEKEQINGDYSVSVVAFLCVRLGLVAKSLSCIASGTILKLCSRTIDFFRQYQCYFFFEIVLCGVELNSLNLFPRSFIIFGLSSSSPVFSSVSFFSYIIMSFFFFYRPDITVLVDWA